MLSLRVLHVGLFASILAATSVAQSFTYSDFTVTAGLVLNGNAVQTGSILQVTPSAASQAGTTWLLTPYLVAAGFDTTFTFQMSNQIGGGADGMAFVIQTDPAATAALGGNGGAMAYSGFTNCLAIEIDTWQNTGDGDISGNEISVHTAGPNPIGFQESFSIGRITPTVNFSDGLVHTMRVEYVPGTLNVYLDNLTTALLSIPYDILNGGNFLGGLGPVGGIPLIGGGAYIGFAAGTGAASEGHDLLSWSWTSTPLPDACFGGTVGVTAGGPYDVLTLNGSTGGIARRFATQVGQPLRFDILQPPSNPMPARFALFGLIGIAGPADLYMTPFGTMCIAPSPIFNVPWLFTLANSLNGIGPGVLPAGPAPWGFNAHLGIPYAVQCTLQAVIEDAGTVGTTLAVTNGIVLDVVPGPAPMITTIAPNVAVPGTNITVTGTNFQAGAAVNVLGVPVVPTSISPTQISFVCPGGVLCGSAVTVINPDGQMASRAFNPQPAITQTVLPSGPAAGGANFIIVGTGFTTGMTVTIDGNPATVTSQSTTSIIMQTPPGTTGPKPVVITSLSGCTAMTTYTYL